MLAMVDWSLFSSVLVVYTDKTRQLSILTGHGGLELSQFYTIVVRVEERYIGKISLHQGDLSNLYLLSETSCRCILISIPS